MLLANSRTELKKNYKQVQAQEIYQSNSMTVTDIKILQILDET